MERQHAIVIGASIAGLGSARVLSKYFDRVTVLDRDQLPTSTEKQSRDAIIQGNHAHFLWSSGYRVLDHYFPGMMDEIITEGGLCGDAGKDFCGCNGGNWGLRIESELPFLACSRSCLESKIRKYVQALPNVSILEKHNVLEPIFDSSSEMVKGVKVINTEKGETQTLEADLVLDAGGRASLSPKWLVNWSYEKPEETWLKIDITYSTYRFERKPNDLRTPLGVVITGAGTFSKRTGYAFAIEDDQWLITLVGKLGDHPPLRKLEDFREFARSLSVPDIYDLIKNREPISEFYEYNLQGYRRISYEKMSRFPRHYLIIGDAFCNLNPCYGQGMSASLLAVKALDECLEKGRENLTQRFFAKVSAIIDIPWTINTRDDLSHPEVEGKRPSGLRYKLHSMYMQRVFLASRKNPDVRKRVLEVITLTKPPSRFYTPNIMWKVLAKN